LREDVLRKTVAIVSQKAQLFAGTIRSNLLWGDESADEAQLWQALETAQAAEFVKIKGLDADVEQGGRNLSGGQKQRLTIARALVAKPEILILDDASSALDYRTDAKLRRALREHYRNTTTVLVAQRISSLRHADLILVLQEGSVIGMGNHDQLMASCEEYAYLARIQMGEGQEVV
jgi:ABC-type multidrug transport system fused ATPase/permease subunit